MILIKDMNEERMKKIKYDLECFVSDFDILPLKDKKFRARSILWKLNLCKLTPKQLSERSKLGRKNALNKVILKNLSDNSLKN